MSQELLFKGGKSNNNLSLGKKGSPKQQHADIFDTKQQHANIFDTKNDKPTLEVSDP